MRIKKDHLSTGLPQTLNRCLPESLALLPPTGTAQLTHGSCSSVRQGEPLGPPSSSSHITTDPALPQNQFSPMRWGGGGLL